LELFLITCFVVGLSVLPAAKEDADPFEGEGAEGGVVAVSAGPEVFVKGLGPSAPLAGFMADRNVCPTRRRVKMEGRRERNTRRWRL
jgi:hypothetical protein